ncbi:MAG TPA: hypothetical protein VGV37_13350 [Aliidongia sp.]|uniref:hypothetical protein n=1 Tax=Aliidongia sp. TaxID=1914230 RepID=UPI002DDD1FE8|nr:hypothetical protein [Aliidongia sp.]HEV2675524.1 hypothetical protein [Aliidongia sp.]
MSARRPITGELLLELTTAASAAAQVLPRRETRARYRLQHVVQQLVASAGAGHLLIDRPTREVAFDQLRAAVKAARAAGVEWRDVVVLVNGDDER